MTRVKICGITNLEDAQFAIEGGADELGFNFYEKSSRYISPLAAKIVIEKLPESMGKVGVFVNMSLEGVLETAKITGITAIQIHGDEDQEFVRELRRLSNRKIIKAIRVTTSIAFEYDPALDAHAILLDSWSAKEFGGTGKTFDWEIAKIASEVFPSLYLAGGLTPDNVTEAIRIVRPYAVDVASGVESSPGKKDPAKVQDFLRAVKLSNPPGVSGKN